ncbi:uncharacterized protein B0H64DRAFT_173440 [Chaetomium fimeti]|uniref:BTB domain-containing protein n=1 Tax=Chaetomium fimeti TaxID=1854472 RepID=A0AAE0LQL0_9PEZI|nr:hypothetical protein B0H64DRAFT_173440 [Chaetomium fimeti]
MNEENAQKTIDIAPDGDVVFVIGTTEKRVRVYSLFVKAASPVLNAMLGPNFEEGQQLAKTGSAEIALPEDNVEAIEIIFNVIHGRNDKVRETLSPRELLQVAIVSDKYDCSVSLAFAIRVWLSPRGGSDPEELWALAMAAYLFREREAFEKATSALVFNHGESYINLSRKHEAVMNPIILLNTAAMLEEARNKLRMSLLMDVLNGDWHCGSSSKKGRHRPDWLMEFVRRAGNLGNTAISSTLEALDQDAGSSVTYIADEAEYSRREQTFKSITEGFRTRHQNAGGLCIWCVRTGEDHGNHK